MCIDQDMELGFQILYDGENGVNNLRVNNYLILWGEDLQLLKCYLMLKIIIKIYELSRVISPAPSQRIFVQYRSERRNRKACTHRGAIFDTIKIRDCHASISREYTPLVAENMWDPTISVSGKPWHLTINDTKEEIIKNFISLFHYFTTYIQQNFAYNMFCEIENDKWLKMWDNFIWTKLQKINR